MNTRFQDIPAGYIVVLMAKIFFHIVDYDYCPAMMLCFADLFRVPSDRSLFNGQSGLHRQGKYIYVVIPGLFL